MNTLKTSKVLALVLALAMVLAVVPGFVASAADGEPDFTFEAFNNALGQDPVNYKKFNPTTGDIEVQFDLTYVGASINGNDWIGLGSSYINASPTFGNSAIGMHGVASGAFRFNNGGTQDDSSLFNVVIGETYHVSIITNTAEKTYSAVVTDAAGEVVGTATDFAYRKGETVELDTFMALNNGGGAADTFTVSNLQIWAENVAESATVTVKYENGEVISVDDSYYVGYPYAVPSVPAYYVNGDVLYTVGAVEGGIADKTEIEVIVPITAYRTIASENLTTNGDLEADLDAEGAIVGWETLAGPITAENENFELVEEEDGNHAIAAKSDGNADNETLISKVAVTAGKEYYVTVDLKETDKTKAEQYMWFAGINDETADLKNGNDPAASGRLGDTQFMKVSQGKYVTTQRVVAIPEGATDLALVGTYFQDTHPVIDNFAVYELKDLDTTVHYSIEYTIDGETVATDADLSGNAGDKVEIKAGDKVNAKRVGAKYYSNPATEITLELGKDVYTVECEVVATITGAEAVTATVVGDYAPVLPKTVKVVTDNEAINGEVVAVTWDGTTGTIDGTDITVAADVTTLEETFSVIDINGVRVQNNQPARMRANAYKLPKALDGSFTAQMTLTVNATGDTHIGFFNSDVLAATTEGNLFADTTIHLPYGNPDAFGLRDASARKNTSMVPAAGKTYVVLVQADMVSKKVTLTVTNEDGEVASVESETGLRKDAASVDILGLYSNTVGDGFATLSNIKFNVPEMAAVTDKATLKASLDFLTDGDNKDALTINFTADGDYAGKTLKIVAGTYIDGNHNAAEQEVAAVALEEGKNVVAFIPTIATKPYRATIVDEAGYAYAEVTAALYPMVAADIAANLAEYVAADELARVEQAVAALSAGGAVYDAEGNFGDGRDKFIDVEIGEESTIITLDEGLYAKGIGFKVSTKAGVVGALKTAAKDELFYKITITGDEVTLESADSVVTFSLDSVEIEFVATEVADSAADGADAELDFIPEL